MAGQGRGVVMGERFVGCEQGKRSPAEAGVGVGLSREGGSLVARRVLGLGRVRIVRSFAGRARRASPVRENEPANGNGRGSGVYH